MASQTHLRLRLVQPPPRLLDYHHLANDTVTLLSFLQLPGTAPICKVRTRHSAGLLGMPQQRVCLKPLMGSEDETGESRAIGDSTRCVHLPFHQSRTFKVRMSIHMTSRRSGACAWCSAGAWSFFCFHSFGHPMDPALRLNVVNFPSACVFSSALPSCPSRSIDQRPHCAGSSLSPGRSPNFTLYGVDRTLILLPGWQQPLIA